MTDMMRRVAVTGVGVVSPLGSDKNIFWNGLLEGRSAIEKVTKLDPNLYPRNLAAEIKDWDQLPEADDPSLKPYGQAVAYSVAASRMALHDAGLEAVTDVHNNYDVLIGTTMGNQDIVERIINEYDLSESDPLKDIRAKDLGHFSASLLSTEVARRFGFKGSALTFVNACAAGNYAVGTAFDRIRTGRSKMILAGGADPFSRTCYTIFHRLNASSGDACRPFDQERNGMVVGEGAAMLVLEDYEHARNRGANIYAEVTGYALTCDAYHATAPHPEGHGAIKAMKRALHVAGLSPDQIDYVSAHGTGTAANDQSEATALHDVFGDRLPLIPVSSIKSMIGHCMGAASAFEAVACAMAIHHQRLPPTINTTMVDSAFPSAMDVVPGKSRNSPVNHVMSNAFAFGGNVSSIILSRLAPDDSNRVH